MNEHEAKVRKVLSRKNSKGYLKSRESFTIDFKEAFQKKSTIVYARTMAAFANNKGGYIIFGVKDSPRQLIGLKNDKFDNFSQERFSESINSVFAPALEWKSGSFSYTPKAVVDSETSENRMSLEMQFGWIYTWPAENKPIIAIRNFDEEKIKEGDVFYRYQSRTERIKYAEMNQIIEERISRERKNLIRLFETVHESGTANLGIVNYNNGRISTPYGVDAAIDRKLVAQVLKKAKFIKEGSFNETKGVPVIKVTGNIDLAEEIPVPEMDLDEGYPYIQKQLAILLGITTYYLYALIWHYEMKESKKYSISVTTSSAGRPSYKFSEFALRFLKEKIEVLKNDPYATEEILRKYRERNKGS